MVLAGEMEVVVLDVREEGRRGSCFGQSCLKPSSNANGSSNGRCSRTASLRKLQDRVRYI